MYLVQANCLFQPCMIIRLATRKKYLHNYVRTEISVLYTYVM